MDKGGIDAIDAKINAKFVIQNRTKIEKMSRKNRKTSNNHENLRPCEATHRDFASEKVPRNRATELRS